MGSALISWKCKKQTTVSVSTAEAEYRALGATFRELCWLTYLMQDTFIPVSLPISLYCDNQVALHITKNQVFHERTRHLEMDCHFVRDKYRNGFITPLFVSSACQIADFFTKALPIPRFHHLLSKLSMLDLYNAELAGG